MSNSAKAGDIINSINEISIIARKRGIAHLFTEDQHFNGREITINGKKLINFGSCSYMGLETDRRIKDEAHKALENYGSQFSCSRAYVSCTPYYELEQLIGRMFGYPFLLSTCSTLGHNAVMPIVMEEGDAVVLDQQAHVSMQEVCRKLQMQGVTVTIIRHNRLDMLEEKIKLLERKHNKIWYVIDGVYSMYGDLAPISEIIEMLERHRKLHLYVDDAHGMSWAGKNGTGYILSQVELHRKMILGTSLAKGFASAGGVFVFPDEALCMKVKNWGGPLTYSGPQQPAVIGASIASAKIHLSDEFRQLQIDLSEKIAWCNQLLKEKELPVVTDSDSPIFFVGLGLTKVGYNMVYRMINDGFNVNLGIFPAVPETCTGIRFTITRHHSKEDISNLADRIAYHLPKALKEEGRTMQDIFKAFRKITGFEHIRKAPVQETQSLKLPEYKVECYTSVKSIPEDLWNSLLGNKSTFDWKGLAILEESFRDNERKEHNWGFHYYLVKDKHGKPVIATYFTSAWTKDDMLSSADISRAIEEVRQKQPYFLTSKTFMMGSLLSCGQHLYLDKADRKWQEAMMLLMDRVWKDQDHVDATSLTLRDFRADDDEIADFFQDIGFFKTKLPDNYVLKNMDWNTREEFLRRLPKKKRNEIKSKVIKNENLVQVRIGGEIQVNEVDRLWKLYMNVKDKSFELNTFSLPKKLFNNMIKDQQLFDVIRISPKDNVNDLPVAVGFAYKNDENYNFIILGRDYKYDEEFQTYRQLILQAILRAKSENFNNLNLGFTSPVEKKRFGAIAEPLVAFQQNKDSFNFRQISVLNRVEPETQQKVLIA